jgi:RNA polymerase sigma-70 factor (sigma-E family)
VDFVVSRQTRLRRAAYAICGDWHRADDLTQIAFVKLYGAWEQIRDHAALDAYVRRCLMRVAVDESRRPWRRERAVEVLPEVTDQSGIAADIATGVVDREFVRLAMAEVPAGQRAVLVLRYYEGMDVSATAAALECSEGNVKSQTARGLAALKAALARHSPAGGDSR